MKWVVVLLACSLKYAAHQIYTAATMRQFLGIYLIALWMLSGCGSKPVPWLLYTDASDGFSVLMPGTPKRELSTQRDSSGQAPQRRILSTWVADASTKWR